MRYNIDVSDYWVDKDEVDLDVTHNEYKEIKLENKNQVVFDIKLGGYRL